MEEKGNALSLIKLRLQYLTMILHALNICLSFLRSTIRTGTRGVDVPISKDGGRHIEAKSVNCFLFFLRLLVCVMSYSSSVERIGRLFRSRENWRCDCG